MYKSLGQAGKLGILLGSGAMFPISRYEPVSTGALGQRAVSVPVKRNSAVGNAFRAFCKHHVWLSLQGG
ncbi:MAG: hypothetical protein R2778_00255 [Saprospiraceae bacterium]